ncbi:MAG: hypothetical protein LBC06_00390 [Rickettsiales bacterium]|jgi:hypothetical protein|nr:hypothetical protein [Rickettsiales bacterium]
MILSVDYIKTSIMSSSTSEEKKNPVVTLRTQAEGFDFSKLRAGEDNAEATSGYQAYKDINRMNFVIQDRTITKKFINELYNRYNNLVESEQYREFAKEVFKEMFKYAKAEVPSDPILEELVTNCNQAGYEFIYAPFMSEFSNEHALHMDVNSSNVNRRVLINRKKNSDSVSVECSASAIPVKVPGGKNRATCDISFSVGFTLNPQGDKSVTYKDGKLSLTVPERLKDYNTGDKSLFDVIQDYFYKFCEKLGFFTEKVEHGLDDTLKVNSCVTSLDVDHLSNKRGV